MDRGRDRATAVGRVTLEYRIGDVRDRLAEIPDGSIDLVVTSPPFLALRSYLPADHPDKHREIGSEPTPADFLDTMLGLSAEFARVLAPHGSICVELGDTYSGGTSEGSDTRNADSQRYRGPANGVLKPKNGSAWPLAAYASITSAMLLVAPRCDSTPAIARRTMAEDSAAPAALTQ